jgi:hypothetical protein
MAQKRLNKDQIAPADLLDNVGDGADKNEKKVKKLTASLKALKKVAKELKTLLNNMPQGGGSGGAGGKKPNIKDLKELNRLTEQANDTARLKLQIDKELVISKEKINIARRSQIKTIKEELALAKSQKGSLERVRLQSKKLRNEKEKLDLTSKKGNQRLKVINRTLDRNNAILDKNATKLGKQKNAIGKYSNALRGLRSGLAALGVSMGVFALIRDSFNVIKDFQQAQANLASVLGVNVEEMKALTAQAKELGATTRFTASQVSELQVELAKLGFTQQQIQDMTPATLALAEATGTELANAAAVAGSTLNAFGLEAKDTQRVVDVMAKSFSSSSLDMEKFKTAMAAVAPIAKTMGFSIEETTSMLGTLTDSGLDASTAGTSLRNMMLEASKQGLTWKEALDKVNDAQDKAGVALELFGKRGVAAGVILAENQDKVAGLTDKLEDAEGAAQKMADTQRNTLAGSLDLLRSAWEGLILSMDEAGGIGDTLKIGIKFLADNLVSVVKILTELITILILYKTTLAALKLRDRVKDQIAYNKSLKQGGKDAVKATTGVKAFGAALKSIGLALVITLVLELAVAWLKVASGAQQAAKFTKVYQAAQKTGNEQAEAKVEKVNSKLEKQIQNIKVLASEQKKLAKTEAERRKIDEKAEEDIKDLTKAKEKGLKADVDRVKTAKIAAKEIAKAAKKERDDFERAHGGRAAILAEEVASRAAVGIGTLGISEIYGAVADDGESLQEKLNRLDNAVTSAGRSVGKTTAVLDVYRRELKSTTDVVIGFNIEEGNSLEPIDAKAEAVKNLNTVLEDQNEILSRQLELLQELDQIEFTRRVRDVQSEIDEEVANAAKGARETGELDVDFVESLIAKKNDILREATKERQEFEIASIIETNRIESAESLSSLEEKRDELLAQEGLTAEQKLDIQAQFQEQLKQLEMNELQRAADLELEIRLIKERTSEELIEIKNAENDELNTINDELIDAQIEGAEKLSEVKDQELEDEKKRLEELRDLTERFGNEVLDGLIARSKKKQSILDEEISKEQELLDTLREGAKDQNAIATESIAQAESNIEAKERQKIEEAEREARLEEIKAIWNALNNFLDQGDSLPEATIKATTGVFGVRKIIESIPGFITGTKGRMKNERKADMSGKDGHIIRIDDDEAILNSGNMDKAEAYGMNTTDDIVNDAVKFHQMQAINNSNLAHNNSKPNDNSELIGEIRDLKKVMKNKPEVSFHPHIIQGMADGLTKKVKKGSLTNNFITHSK